VSKRHPLLIGLIAAAFLLQRWHLDTLEEQWPTVWLLAKHAIPMEVSQSVTQHKTVQW